MERSSGRVGMEISGWVEEREERETPIPEKIAQEIGREVKERER